MKNWLKSFVHNVIVHPLMMCLPTDLAHYMHDKNAYWAFGPFTCDELDLEGVKTPWNQETSATGYKACLSYKTLKHWMSLIRAHLYMVFIHEIDPSFPQNQQEQLNKPHKPINLKDIYPLKKDTNIRC